MPACWKQYRTLVALRRSSADLASGDLAATDLMWSGPDDSAGPWRGLLDLRRGDARILVNLDDDERAITLEPDVPLVVAAAWNTVRYDGPDTLATHPSDRSQCGEQAPRRACPPNPRGVHRQSQ